MDSLLLKKRIYQVEVPPETISGWTEKQDKEFEIYGRFFVNRSEFEYFAMLPLTDEQRLKILGVLKRESDFRDELRYCTGKIGSGKGHRLLCTKCCITERPLCAKQYY